MEVVYQTSQNFQKFSSTKLPEGLVFDIIDINPALGNMAAKQMMGMRFNRTSEYRMSHQRSKINMELPQTKDIKRTPKE